MAPDKRSLRTALRRVSRSTGVPSRFGSRGEKSPWVRAALRRLRDTPPGIALDIPSGRGRHSQLLTELGYIVVAADLDIKALRETSARSRNDAVLPVRLDALKPLPFADETFDLLVVIHPHLLDVLPAAKSSLRVGGYVIFETFGAHGENWRWLPKRHQVSDVLLAGFEVLVCKESPVAKSPDFFTVKGVFRKTKK
jgi:SAM-dependent methyltransferase